MSKLSTRSKKRFKGRSVYICTISVSVGLIVTLSLSSSRDALFIPSHHATKGSACLEGEGWPESQLGWCRLKSPARKADRHRVYRSSVRRSTTTPTLVLPIGAL